MTQTEHDGTITTLVDTYEGKRLNSPNDVVVKSDGTIWFTDPTYGILTNYEGHRAEPEQIFNQVFRLDPETGDLSAVASDFTQPNGLAFSPDECILYMAEADRSHDPNVKAVLRAFDVTSDNRLRNGREFAKINPGVTTGCVSTVSKILVPETVSNLTFGGRRGNMRQHDVHHRKRLSMEISRYEQFNRLRRRDQLSF